MTPQRLFTIASVCFWASAAGVLFFGPATYGLALLLVAVFLELASVGGAVLTHMKKVEAQQTILIEMLNNALKASRRARDESEGKLVFRVGKN